MTTQLLEALKSGSLLLFIGMDLPRKVTGLPSRSELANRLAERKGLDCSYSLAEIAQRVSQAGNRWEFTSFIRDELDITGKSPKPFHKHVAKFVQEYRLGMLITTTFDSLLDTALQQDKLGVNRVVRGSDIHFINPDRTTLIKLYGDIQQPDTLIVTDQDHFNLLRDREKEPILDEVRRAFRRNTVLFIGYNLADPDFRFIFDQVAGNRFARMAYAVWPGLSELDKQMWKDRGITILDTDPFGLVSGYGFEPVAEPILQPEDAPELASSAEQILENLQRIERKIDQGHTEYSEAAAQIMEAITEQKLNLEDANQLMRDLQDWARKVQESGQSLSPELRVQVDALTTQTAGVNEYFQLAIPIVPGILSYNIELGSQHQVDLKAVWAKIMAKLKPKGDREGSGAKRHQGKGNRWAVVVGINQYDDSIHYGQLNVCVRDAEAVFQQLVVSGYEQERIRLLTDEADELPDRDHVLVALHAIAQATEPEDVLVFFYSGHGDEDGGESYLVARNGKRLALEDTAIKVSRIKHILGQAPARAKIIIVDACHSGANIEGKGAKQMSEAFIRRVFEHAEGLAILASCKQGQVSYEWQTKERSVFTHYFLEAMQGKADLDAKGFVTVQDTHRHVSNGVRLWSSQRNLSQTPTLQAEVAGDIILTYVTGEKL